MAFQKLIAPGVNILGKAAGASALGPALLSGGASVLGGVISNMANAKEARKQRAWQENMSNTSHQREVADLRAAGLNPILSGTGGMGASTPSGGQATMHDPVSGAVTSAQAARRLEQELENMEQQAQQSLSQTLLNNQHERVAHETVNKTRAETSNLLATNPLISQQTKTELQRTLNEQAQVHLNQQRKKTEEAETKIRGHGVDVASAKATAARLFGSGLDESSKGWSAIGNAIKDFMGGGSAKSHTWHERYPPKLETKPWPHLKRPTRPDLLPRH